jgi:hypothetical protein
VEEEGLYFQINKLKDLLKYKYSKGGNCSFEEEEAEKCKRSVELGNNNYSKFVARYSVKWSRNGVNTDI